MNALSTILCGWPGCPSDAAPDASYCGRHAERFRRGERPPPRDCAGPGCKRSALEGTVYCADCNRERLLGSPAEPGVVLCHYEGCEDPALEETIGARKQGGRYEICAKHLEALRERANDTRRRNREAQGLPASASAPSREEPKQEAPVLARNEIGNNPSPEIREDGPTEDALREEVLDRVNGLPPIPTPELDGPTGDDPACPYWCALDQPHDGECHDFAGRSAQQRLDQHITELVVPHRRVDWTDVEPEDTRRAAAGFAAEHDGPERAPTWEERGRALADVGAQIDRLERELEEALARWRILSA